MSNAFRPGVVVREPFKRLLDDEIGRIDRASRNILSNTGVISHNEKATKLYKEAGASVTAEGENAHRIKIPSELLDKALKSVPKSVTLGARNPENSIVLDSENTRVYFGSGSETNIWLDVEFQSYTSDAHPEQKRELPVFTQKRGSIERLETAARLADGLDNLDFFIRPVNIQDDDINEHNHDVNKFYASLKNITKHVQAGVTDTGQLDNVLKMASLIVGGDEELRKNPIVSFITCVIKSPLEMVEDATEKMMEISKRGMPVVISSCPQGGSTAPIHEAGMVAQINAEILAGAALSQLVNPGAPVLYGSVPIRARMDNLHDMYGAPDFNRYGVDCVQMARHYKIPCYSTAGAADAAVPGVEAAVEKLFTHIPIAMSGAQYVHYAFGLLDRTNVFCPVQAVIDNEHIGMIKQFLKAPDMSQETLDSAQAQIDKVMSTPQKLYVRYVRKELKKGNVYPGYPFESKDGYESLFKKAAKRMDEILSETVDPIPADIEEEIFKQVPGIVDRLKTKR